MIRSSSAHRIARHLVSCLLIVAASSWQAEAGGPLFINAGKAVLWANHTVTGGPLNSTTVTVDKNGTRKVLYRVDSGRLGTLSNAEGVRLTDRIFKEYSEIPTANINFMNAGPIVDPETGEPVDVDGSNFARFVDSEHPTFQNPIIFDDDASILGSGGILGAFFTIAFEPDNSAFTEGAVVLNGRPLTLGLLSTTSFLGVFTHEFGHFAGPLDHEQSSGGIAWGLFDAAIPAGFNFTDAYDLFAPFTETMYPILFGGTPDSALVDFPDSGYFIATLDRDTKNALSNLYPNGAYRLTTGSIDGQVFFRSGRDRILVSGINVVARRISQGAYPPPLGTKAFPTPPTIDADGVPSRPPHRPVTDSLSTVSSAVTGLDFGRGTYRIQGLPFGLYEVMLQEIYPGAIGGSGIGPLAFQLPLPVFEEYFRVPKTSNDVKKFTPVLTLPLGITTRGIDLEINGLDSSEPNDVEESGSHLTVATAQSLGPLPARLSGEAADTDPVALGVDFGGGAIGLVHDVYKFTLTDPSTLVWISLEPTSENGDLDLYLFFPDAAGLVPIEDVPRYSATESGHELIGAVFGPGTWYVGVSAFQDDLKYKLRVISQAK